MSGTNKSGQRWARAGFVFGAAGSLAGNVLAAWLPYGTGPGKTPGHAPIAQQVGSLVWPVCLIVAIEVMSRISWPKKSSAWKVARFGGLGALAAGCAVISYGHICRVLTAWDYGRFGSLAGAVALDALMVLCALAMLAANRSDDTELAPAGHHAPGSAGAAGRESRRRADPPAHLEQGTTLTPLGVVPADAGRGEVADNSLGSPAGPSSASPDPTPGAAVGGQGLSGSPAAPPAPSRTPLSVVAPASRRTGVSGASTPGVRAVVSVVPDTQPAHPADTPSGHRQDTRTPGPDTGAPDSARTPGHQAAGQVDPVSALLLSGQSVRAVAQRTGQSKTVVGDRRRALVQSGQLKARGAR